jgi:hypothetical protein
MIGHACLCISHHIPVESKSAFVLQKSCTAATPNGTASSGRGVNARSLYVLNGCPGRRGGAYVAYVVDIVPPCECKVRG